MTTNTAILTRLLSETENSNILPIAIYKNLTKTYVIYGLTQVGNQSGYKVVKTVEVNADHTYMESGFLLETIRVLGANGSTTNVNLKTDSVNTLLVLGAVNFG